MEPNINQMYCVLDTISVIQPVNIALCPT